MAIFNKRYTNIADELRAQGKPADQGTLGPNAPAKFNPEAFKDSPFAAKLYDSPLAKGFADQSFSSDSAKQWQSRFLGPELGLNFGNDKDNTLGYDFLQKYKVSMMVPEEQKISEQTIDFLRQQQPGEGINDQQVVASGKMNVPGSGGTSVG